MRDHSQRVRIGHLHMALAISSSSSSAVVWIGDTPNRLSSNRKSTRAMPASSAAWLEESLPVSNSLADIASFASRSNWLRYTFNVSGNASGYSTANDLLTEI